VLQSTYDKIQTIPKAHTPISTKIEKAIEHHLADNLDERINIAPTPAEAGSALGRFRAMVSSEFKPQHTTSLATVRHYNYQTSDMPTEYRFGTQAQRHDGQERVSPLFKHFLTGQAKPEDPKKITHVYINNLGRDRTDWEGKKEKALTQVLHKLEDNHPNIAVITIPADKGLMSQHEIKKIKPEHEYDDVRNEFINIAAGNDAALTKTKDFYISDNIRAQLFGNKQQPILEGLVDKSFKAMHIEPNTQLSGAQRQAVYFHFMKFELPHYIFNKLEPQSMNFSCKDAIDRGGVSSAYYNLVNSFDTEQPMSLDEFSQALHAAPAMVKARGMNHHINLIWNTVDAYVDAHKDTLTGDKAWLIEWRDLNCPKERINHLLEKRITEGIAELEAAKQKEPNDNTRIDMGINILKHLRTSNNLKTHEKRLLLMTAIRIPKIILNPSDEQAEKHLTEISNKTKIKAIWSPTFHKLHNLLIAFLKIFIGEQKQATQTASANTAKASMEKTRDMKDVLNEIKTPHTPKPKEKPEQTNDDGHTPTPST